MTKQPDRLANPFAIISIPLKHTTVQSKTATPQPRRGKPSVAKAQGKR